MELRGRPFVFVSTLLVLALVAVYLSLPLTHQDVVTDYGKQPDRASFMAPKQNIWAELSVTEALSLIHI